MNWKQNVLAVAAFALLALPAYSQTGSSGGSNPQGTVPSGSKTEKEGPTGSSSQSGTSGSSAQSGTSGSSAQTGGSGTSSDTGATGTSGQAGATDASSRERPKLLLVFLHRDNQNEIELAKMAKENSGSKEVKDFADRIMKDHQNADEQVMAYAKSHNIDLNAAQRELSEISKEKLEEERRSRAVGTATGEWAVTWENELRAKSEHKEAIEKLRTLKGAEFDRMFTRTMVERHQTAVDRLAMARTRVRDSELISLIDKLLPTYKEHLSMAQKLQASVSKA
jgi:putative membrane protein